MVIINYYFLLSIEILYFGKLGLVFVFCDEENNNLFID